MYKIIKLQNNEMYKIIKLLGVKLITCQIIDFD